MSLKSFHLGPGAWHLPGARRFADVAGTVRGAIRPGRHAVEPFPGAVMQLDRRDPMERAMAAGVWEPHVRKALTALIRPGDVVVDVGAHIGYIAALSATLVGAPGRVVAFEPDPDLYARMRLHLAIFPWAEEVEAAVADRDGAMAFERAADAGYSGWGTLASVRVLDENRVVEVEALRLDSWAEQQSLQRLDWIKIDAEGAEPQILAGAKQTIDRLRPGMLLEHNPTLLSQAGSSGDVLVRLLADLDYAVIGLGWQRWRGGVLIEHDDAPDWLAVPRERSEGIREALRRDGFQ